MSDPLPEKPSRRSWQRIAKWAVFSCLLLILGSAGALYFVDRSTFLKMIPATPFEVIELSGSASNGTIIDCHGGWFNDGKPTELIIRSVRKGSEWDRPSDIIISNCRLRGSIRIMGMGRNGEARDVKESSIREGHTARAQAAAPTRILISGVEIEADHRIPLYLSPGVMYVTIENSTITGWTSSVGLYLDAESGHNTIQNNTFVLRPGREVIAIDGSAENRITGNRFVRMPGGGIYLYRNCGEGGTVRHQTPHGNVISDNSFDTRSLGFRSYGIWLGSRNGKRIYRNDDAGYPFGSSLDDRDFADENTVTGNLFTPKSDRAIRDDGQNNRVEAKAPHSLP